MTLTTLVPLVLALHVVQLFLQETSAWRLDLRAIMGHRDRQPRLSALAARLLYVPACASGIPVLRALIWLAGLALMALALR